ncbi:hypothetical protein DS745_03580 [Anaerobacillus alkaliphilus]|uniref:Uncharacterized protein n=1 Tax=Anaerobacillus alkaliphilus TaxID=1548597 RepID=A0A4V1LGZ7_9BACI|nr:hypothetical protein [Anaerobacillus alkaliphilus]RXJ04475.1 hypothetical protein DS745_03580 [Anaerobacillus alkaliphilus]
MTVFWGIVLLVIIGFVVFGYLVDKRSDRYRRMSDKNVKSGIEAVKDQTQKQNPSNSDWHV